MRARVLILDIETTGLDPFTNQILMIGYSLDGMDGVLEGDESEILRKLAQMLKGVEVLVGYNLEFDLKFIKVRCIAHGLGIRFPTSRVDLARIAHWRKRLEDWCRFLGIERDFSVDGSCVPGLYKHGLERIRRHCLDDVKAMRLLWERYKRVI